MAKKICSVALEVLITLVTEKKEDDWANNVRS